MHYSGAGYARKWAQHDATIIIGDVNKNLAEKVVDEIRSETKNKNVFFVQCDVTDWDSQVSLFKEARKLSAHGGIDCVVANAGIAGVDKFEQPEFPDPENPPPPNFKTLEVNLIGLLYTTHLALYWLARNPGSTPCSVISHPVSMPRDRHLLLVGSMASLSPLPAQALYGVAKHGVLGCFRSLRATSFAHGIRVNMICPYFIETNIMPVTARTLLAGGGVGKADDVVDAATRLTADTRIIGRSLYIGPKMKVSQDGNGEYQLAMTNGKERTVWEAYAEDWEDSELFSQNLVRLLNQFTRFRGWGGYITDMVKAVKYGFVG